MYYVSNLHNLNLETDGREEEAVDHTRVTAVVTTNIWGSTKISPSSQSATTTSPLWPTPPDRRGGTGRDGEDGENDQGQKKQLQIK